MVPDVFENGLLFHCRMAREELAYFLEFHVETERSWRQKDHELQEKIENMVGDSPAAEYDELIETYSWDLHCRQVKFPEMHRLSLVALLYSFVETQLSGLSSTVGESLGSRLGLKDLHGAGIERALLFLRKVGGFDLSRIGHLSLVYDFGRIRNIIIHADGRLPLDGKNPVNVFVKSSPYLSGQPGGELRVTPEFIVSVGEGLIEFFNELELEVSNFIRRIA